MNVGLKGAEPLPSAAVIMPYAYTPVVPIGLSGILVVISGLMGTETRDVDLHAIDARALGAARSAGG